MCAHPEASAAQTAEAPFPLSTLRHSVAHLMASAVGRLYPGAKYGFGPAIDHGFYYDFDLPEPLTDADLKLQAAAVDLKLGITARQDAVDGRAGKACEQAELIIRGPGRRRARAGRSGRRACR